MNHKRHSILANNDVRTSKRRRLETSMNTVPDNVLSAHVLGRLGPIDRMHLETVSSRFRSLDLRLPPNNVREALRFLWKALEITGDATFRINYHNIIYRRDTDVWQAVYYAIEDTTVPVTKTLQNRRAVMAHAIQSVEKALALEGGKLIDLGVNGGRITGFSVDVVENVCALILAVPLQASVSLNVTMIPPPKPYATRAFKTVLIGKARHEALYRVEDRRDDNRHVSRWLSAEGVVAFLESAALPRETMETTSLVSFFPHVIEEHLGIAPLRTA